MPAIAAVAHRRGVPRRIRIVFGPLAASSLVFGAFAAGLVLLFVPLVAASAMNPLLVAILLAAGRRAQRRRGRRQGVLREHVGSVAGVLVTAFGLIPYLSNFASTLVVALVLALLSLAACGRFRAEPMPLHRGTRRSAPAPPRCSWRPVLLWDGGRVHGAQRPVSLRAACNGSVEASYTSLFGTVKVLRSDPSRERAGSCACTSRTGSCRTPSIRDHRSTSFYTYGLEALARAYRPQDALGARAGTGRRHGADALAESGIAVEVVDIDPVAPRVAQAHFGFDPARVRTHLADARTFVRRCAGATTSWSSISSTATARRTISSRASSSGTCAHCLGTAGIAVFNTFAD